ncbi:MAG TPA: ribosomal L7Ae/L30e/S12e/Gadd45 family protein [Candidatus Egerieicola pullicola]|uniref:Ribosomal L7Ae/L30e/S12e/Gadd45 family protein n=1 Tax=Candidatus Egerieicola pullicola TaxID=2840775 RepID=A0A9D1AJS5_9FIRM|nr:ribosomal L7Ae/L30e/S12e/Gadd45 family protein [Candidatus Egerieicola pullicola]
MNPKLIDTLTFCKRIGALKLGFDPVKSTLEHGQAKLVLLAKDLSSKSKDSMLRICQQDGCPTALLPLQMDEIWFLVGKRSGILAVTDAAFAKKLSELLESVDETNRRDTI